jgi:hypothetical protein
MSGMDNMSRKVQLTVNWARKFGNAFVGTSHHPMDLDFCHAQ